MWNSSKFDMTKKNLICTHLKSNQILEEYGFLPKKLKKNGNVTDILKRKEKQVARARVAKFSFFNYTPSKRGIN
jgi:hypothetical protein